MLKNPAKMNTKLKEQYEGHRTRLRQRFERFGFQGFHDYEILELLLTYAIPRKDTKPIAKELIGRFKTNQKILDIPLDKLKKVDGMGENAALFLKIFVTAQVIQYEKQV